MTTNFKLITLVSVNLVVSAITHLFDFPQYLGISSFFFGTMLYRFYLYQSAKDWWKLILFGSLYYLLFIISSLLGGAFSKSLFKTDDFFPLFSTTFSIVAILYSLKTGFQFLQLIPTALITIIAGIFATYLVMSEWRIHPTNKVENILYDINFVWQTATGISLIIGLDKLIKERSLVLCPKENCIS